MIKRYAYLDNASTTQIAPEVLEAMMPYLTEKYGNANSLHSKGIEAKETLEKSRAIIAKSIGASPEEIIFTSGGTESNNLAIKGIAFANPNKKHIITTKIEHGCTLNACRWLQQRGCRITYLNVDKDGFISPYDLKKAITKETLLFSCIHGNNEIGTLQNLEELGKICRKHKIYFHADAVQSYTKAELNVKKKNLDFVSLSAHKIHGPKGIGALYIKKGIKITPLIHGGGGESISARGTENVAGIIGFAKASSIISKKDIERMRALRDYLIDGIKENIENVKLNGPEEKRLCNNINVSFLGVDGESLGAYLDIAGIATSARSACSSNSSKPSHVLEAIGNAKNEIKGAIRISLSKYTTKEEIDYLLNILPDIVRKLRKA